MSLIKDWQNAAFVALTVRLAENMVGYYSGHNNHPLQEFLRLSDVSYVAIALTAVLAVLLGCRAVGARHNSATLG